MIQLKVKTEYSFGKTFAGIDRVVDRLKAIGCTHAGIVDGGTWGHVAWFKACKAAGIQPLLGVEMVVSDDDTATRMWFLAKNTEGLGELYRCTSKGHRQTVSTRTGSLPRLYQSDVLGMTDSIIKFAGDVVDGEFLRDADAYLDFNPSSRILNMKKKALAKEFGLHCVSTGDNAFAFPEDRGIFELISRAGLKQTPQYILESLDNDEVAAAIAMQCSDLTLPIAPMVRAEGSLEQICRDGIKFRGMGATWTDEYEQRMQYELELIRSKDFESYFIIVSDMVHYAKRHMLVGPSRGSAAGSLVCYLARITEINPIPPGLYFERFIDVSRSDLPDIDLDFPDNKREMVFEYMADKYGETNVAHIGTISQFKPKSALIEVCKALHIPPSATAAVKIAMIERSSADSRANNCLQDTLETTEPGKQFMAMYPQAKVASVVEGHASHTGVHAAGLLVCNDDITNYATVDAKGIAHIDKGAAEHLGLLKIDVLGLRTLGVLEDANVGVDWYNLPLDDQATFDIFNQGRMCGIFQFEGNALRAISRDIDFKTIVEIDAVTALARPGPFGGGVTEKYVKRKNGEPYTPIHPLVEAHMKETFGLPVYQEQTLAIVREIGKFDWKETSTIRKAMSKRMGKEFFDTYWQKFLLGATSQGIGEKEARETWEMINAMGAWQMNKCLDARTYVRIASNNTGIPVWCTIGDLYEKYTESPSPWIRQKKSMPALISLHPDGRGYPQKALKIHKNGLRSCWEYIFSDGSKVVCTKEHKFMVNGKWTEIGKASIGSKFTTLERTTSRCKKRHCADGPRRAPFKPGHEQSFKTLESKNFVGRRETYDIEMPEHHNYVIDGGLVTHNSHTFSYAVISYWTAYLKAHFPLEFAAANLRNAKDEGSAVELLREMLREGVEYFPFDLDKSVLNWSVQDGKLYGGFLALKGIGESKAAKLIAARDAGKLTDKQKGAIEAAENIFSDVFPFQTLYSHLYDDPKANGIIGNVMKIVDIESIPHKEQRVFLGELIYKNARNANEEVNVKRRGGKMEKGPLEFIDVRLRDDTGTIGGRIGRWDFEAIGRELLERVPEGAHLMIRAEFYNNIRYAFIKKYKVLDV